ncbi:unnamed protein product, partial [Heterosigma akashiwo]
MSFLVQLVQAACLFILFVVQFPSVSSFSFRSSLQFKTTSSRPKVPSALRMVWGRGEKNDPYKLLKEYEKVEKEAKQRFEKLSGKMEQRFKRMRKRLSRNQLDEVLEGQWEKHGSEITRGRTKLIESLRERARMGKFDPTLLEGVLDKVAEGVILGGKRPVGAARPEDLEILPSSDLSRLDRRIWVVTTACLPWMTGTSVNPLLRATILAEQRGPGKVTLVVPWLEPRDQERVFPKGVAFDTYEEQDTHVREWLRANTKYTAGVENLELVFYPSRYHEMFGSIFPMGDITDLVPDEEADVCILEEPEHLNWYRAEGSSWYQKFNHVIGICHTNYVTYMSTYSENEFLGNLVSLLNVWMVRAYCHRVIKLSAVLQKYAPEKEVVDNVHGVRDTFLEVGRARAVDRDFPKGAYFIGKKIWGKGYDLTADLLDHARDPGALNRQRNGPAVADVRIDLYGGGPDEEEIKALYEARGLPARFLPAIDHGRLGQYKIFINPSITEVLCTTTAEALAMGKFALIPDHPSNEFFKQFPNCLVYGNKEEFRAHLAFALEAAPAPMTEAALRPFTWEAATERLVAASRITVGERRRFNEELDRFCEWSHRNAGSGHGGDIVRWLTGGVNVAEQAEWTRQVGRATQEAATPEARRAYVRRINEAYSDQVSLVDLLRNYQEVEVEKVLARLRRDYKGRPEDLDRVERLLRGAGRRAAGG